MNSLHRYFVFLLLFGMLVPNVGRTGEAVYFRLTFPEGSSEDARIIGLTSNGLLTWTNVLVGPTATVQRATMLQGPGNWSSLFQTIVTNPVMVADVNFVPAPPGMVLIPGGTNEGTDPYGTGAVNPMFPQPAPYSLTVDSFYMDEYLVTKALWDEVREWGGTNGYGLSEGQAKGTNYPVHHVSWYDVVKWCNARSEREGLEAVYYTDAAFTQVYKANNVREPYVKSDANGYRLPTEEQWMYAARGGVVGQGFPWGNLINHDHANYRANESWNMDNSGYSEDTYHPDYTNGTTPYTSPVGDFAPNGYGLYDMIGNVAEWCYDWDPTTVPEEANRVAKGGSWGRWPNFCTIAVRISNEPGYSYPSGGFRTIRLE